MQPVDGIRGAGIAGSDTPSRVGVERGLKPKLFQAIGSDLEPHGAALRLRSPIEPHVSFTSPRIPKIYVSSQDSAKQRAGF